MRHVLFVDMIQFLLIKEVFIRIIFEATVGDVVLPLYMNIPIIPVIVKSQRSDLGCNEVR